MTCAVCVDSSEPLCPRSIVVTRRRADEERQVAEQERRLADVERARAGHGDGSEREHFRAMKAHERSAELHDAIAGLLPAE